MSGGWSGPGNSGGRECDCGHTVSWPEGTTDEDRAILHRIADEHEAACKPEAMPEQTYYDPTTGKPLHRVPVGATIPADVSYGFVWTTGRFEWSPDGDAFDYTVTGEATPRFTAEPLTPPGPELPNEPGSVVLVDGKPWLRDESAWLAEGDYLEDDGMAKRDWVNALVIPQPDLDAHDLNPGEYGHSVQCSCGWFGSVTGARAHLAAVWGLTGSAS